MTKADALALIKRKKGEIQVLRGWKEPRGTSIRDMVARLTREIEGLELLIKTGEAV